MANTTKLNLDVIDDSEIEFGDSIKTLKDMFNSNMVIIDAAAGNGSVGQLPYASKSANYTVTATDCVIEATNTITFTFPNTIPSGKVFFIVNNAAESLTAAASGTTINGAANISISPNGAMKTVVKTTGFQAV